ncbi:uncharacterized protein LOC142107394 [Mixophyes fleayi]|uniref:uncharacterized protein LOC142107394 n=1 Tax=Mixophyes fleayi TaxID=3061075 RepID=UPI003F4DE88E
MVGGMKAQTLQVVGAGPGAAEGPLAAADSLSQAARTAADPAGLEVQQADAAEVGAVSGPSRPSGSGTQAEAVVSGVDARTISVWFFGHSFIFWAGMHQFAGCCPWVPANSDIIWIGHRGMRWRQFLSVLSCEIAARGVPDILVVHLGGNDIGQMKSLELIINIRDDILTASEYWPSIKFCWSYIVPRRTWRSDLPPTAISSVVRKVNQVASKIFRQAGGFSISHPLLKAEYIHLFRLDGKKLTMIQSHCHFRQLQVQSMKVLQQDFSCYKKPSPTFTNL